MTISRKTALARPLDPGNPCNLLIILITATTFIAATVYQYISTETITIAALSGFKTGITVFMSWAISRELDPDHAFSAFVPVSFVLVVIYFFGLSSILPLFWIIALLRIINRTAGVMPGIPDTLIILSLGILLTFKASWMYGLLTGLGLIVDNRLSLQEKSHLLAGIFIAIVSFLSLTLKDRNLPVLSLSDYPILIAITILFIPVILGSSTVRSIGDVSGERLDPSRVRAAQLMALIIVLSLSLADAGSWLYVMYCIIAGIGIYWVFSGKITAS